MATINDSSSILIYRVGPVLCCAPCDSILSITHPAPLTKLPGQQTRHSGIFKYGKHLVTVSELRKNFGVNPEQWQNPGRIIITELNIGRIGFWVDEIIDVLEPPTTGWGTPPPLIPKTIFSKTLTLDNEIHLYTEFEKLYGVSQIGYLKSYIENIEKLKNQATTKKTTSIQTKEVNRASNKKVTAEKNSSIKDTPDTVILEKSNIKDTNPKKPEHKKIEHEKIKSKNLDLSSKTISHKITKDLDGIKNETVTPMETIKTLNPKTISSLDGTKNPIKTHLKKSKVTTIKKQSVSNPIKKTTADKKIAPEYTGNITKEKIKNNYIIPKNNNINKLKRIESKTTNNNQQSSPVVFVSIILILFSTLMIGSYFLLKNDELTVLVTTKTLSTETTYSSVETTTVSLPETPVETIANSLPETPVETITDLPSETPVETIANSLPETPIETITDLPSETPVETITDLPSEIESTTESTNLLSETTFESTSDSSSMLITEPMSKPPENSNTVIELGLVIPDIRTDDATITKKQSISKKDTSQKNTNTTQNHSAVISKNTKGITITLFTPLAIEQKSKNKPIQQTTIQTQSSISVNKKINRVAAVKKRNIAPSTISKEIIHIVVKGDTLWHIAEFYVDDPYRYPELARLSNINNPDLIYPGDRVHIVQIFTKDTNRNDK